MNPRSPASIHDRSRRARRLAPWVAAAAILLGAPDAARGALAAFPEVCFAAPGATACTSRLQWSALPHPSDPSLTHLQVWEDGEDLVKRLGAAAWCTPADGDRRSRDVTVPVGAGVRWFRVYYAAGCDPDDTDFRQPVGDVAVVAVASGQTRLAPERARCIVDHTAATCKVPLRWGSDGTGFDCVDLWRTTPGPPGSFGAVQCDAVGTGAALGVLVGRGAVESFELHPRSLAPGEESCQAGCPAGAASPPAGPPLAETVLHGRPRLAGMSFQPADPQWFATFDPACPGDSADPACASTVATLDELSEIAAYSGVRQLKLEMSAIRYLEFPVVQQATIDKFARFLAEMNARGLRAIANVGQQCWVPNAKERPADLRPINGGTFEGDPLNNGFVPWTTPHCPDDYVERAAAWYGDLLTRLDAALAAYGLGLEDTVDVLVVNGNWREVLTPEIRLDSEEEYLVYTKRLLAALVPSLREAVGPGVPVGIQTRFYESLGVDRRWDFLTELRDAVPLSGLDYIAMTSAPVLMEDDPDGRPALMAMMRELGRSGGAKMVLSDMKNSILRDAPASAQEANVVQHVQSTRDYGLLGYWYWTYRNYYDEEGELRWVGLRELVDGGADGLCEGWREDLVAPIRSDVGALPPAICVP